MYTALGKFDKAAGRCPEGLLEATGPIARCTGGQFAENCNDFCCPTRTWSNATYRAILGYLSLHYYDEERIRHALKLVAYPVRGFHNGVQEFAYDHSTPDHTVTPDMQLMLGLVRARANFEVMLPKSRWYRKPKGIASPGPPGSCTSDGFYSVWRTKPSPATGAKIRALANAMSTTLPSSFKDALTQRGEFTFAVSPVPSSVKQWDQGRITMMSRVPGSGGGQEHDAMPTVDQLLTVKNGVAVAQPWLAEFLDYFAKGWGGGRLRLPPLKRPPVVAAKIAEEEAASAQQGSGPPPPGAEPGAAWAQYAGIAALTVVTVGGGYWWFTRRG